MKQSTLYIVWVAFLLTGCTGNSSYNLAVYGLKPDSKENAAPLIAQAFLDISKKAYPDSTVILLPKGRYDFYPEIPDLAAQKKYEVLWAFIS